MRQFGPPLNTPLLIILTRNAAAAAKPRDALYDVKTQSLRFLPHNALPIIMIYARYMYDNTVRLCIGRCFKIAKYII